MRCLKCGRQLLHCAVPGVPIGPKCAKDRGMLPERTRRPRLFDIRPTTTDPRQMDWVNLINTGRLAGESSRP